MHRINQADSSHQALTRQQKRARVRERIREEVKEQFSGPRKGIRAVAKEIEHRYWQGSKDSRIMNNLIKESTSRESAA